MKKLIGTALILSMLGGSAAIAAPYGYVNRGHQTQDNSGAIVAGIGLLMLGAFLASQNDRHDYAYQPGYRDYGPNHGWNQGWNRGWNPGWNDRGYGYRGH